MKRRMKVVLVFLLLLLFVPVLLVVGVATTDTLFACAAKMAEKVVPGFEIGSVSGNPVSGFALGQTAFISESVKVQIADVAGQIVMDHPFSLRIPYIRITRPEVTVNTLDTPETEEPEPLGRIRFPVPVSIEDFAVSDLKVMVPGTLINLAKANLTAKLKGSSVELTGELEYGDILTLDPVKPPPGVLKRETEKRHSAEPVRLTLKDVPVPLDVTRLSVSLRDISFGKASEKQREKIERFELTGALNENLLSLEKVLLVSSLVDAKGQGSLTLSGDFPLKGQVEGNFHQAPVDKETLTLDFSGSLANPVIQGDLKGRSTLKLRAKASLTENYLPFSLTVTSDRFTWPLTEEPMLSLANTDIRVSGSLKGYSLALKSRMTADSLPDAAIDLKGEGNSEGFEIKQVSLDTLSGNIDGAGSVSWREAFSASGRMRVRQINPGVQWPLLPGRLSGELALNIRQDQSQTLHIQALPLKLQGVLREQPLDLSGQLRAEIPAQSAMRLAIDNLTFIHGKNKAKVTGGLNGQWHLKGVVDFPNLTDTLPPLAGVVKGEVSLTGTADKPVVDVSLSGSKLTNGQRFLIGQWDATGTISLDDRQASDFQMQVKTGHVNNLALDQVALVLKGTPSQHNLSLTAAGESLEWQMQVTGGFIEPFHRWKGQVNRSKGTLMGRHIALQQPVNIKAGEGSVSFSSHCWQEGQGQLCFADETQLGTEGRLNVKLTAFDLGEVLHPFLQEDAVIQAVVNGHVKARWTEKKPVSIQGGIKVDSGHFVQALGATPFELAWQVVSVSFVDQGDSIRTKVLVDLQNNGALSCDVSLGLDEARHSLGGKIRLDAIMLDQLKPLLPFYDTFSGKLQGQVALSGSLEEPGISGQVAITGLQGTGKDAPLVFESGDVQIRFSQKHAEVTGQLINEGQPLTVRGKADWYQMAAWKLSLTLQGSNLVIRKQPEAEIRVQPDLQLFLTPQLFSIKGKIQIPYARINVRKLPESAVAVSSDEIIVNTAMQQETKADRLPFNLQGNVRLSIGQDVKINALGLTADLAGNILFKTSDNKPLIYGDLEISEGYYKAFAQNLMIQKGRLLFNGPVDQPYLTIKAIRDPKTVEDDVLAGVMVSGPADQPEVKIFSEPPMAQQNALSYVLTGKDLGSDLDANQAVTVMLIGMGLARGNKFVGDVGETIGIKDLSLNAEGAGDTSQVTVSGYIAPRLQVKYGVGVFEDIAEFTVRYKLMKSLFLEAVSSTDDSSLDLLYQFTFGEFKKRDGK